MLENLEYRIVPATFTWTGGGGTNVWSNTANWQGGAAPSTAVGAVNDLVFNNTGAQKSNVDNIFGLVVNSLTFSQNTTGYNITSNVGGFSLGSNNVGSGYITVGQNDANNALALNIQLSGSGSNLQQFITVNVSSNLTISGNISGGSASQLVKDGVGTLILSGNNNGFGGTFSINPSTGGKVVAQTSTALGSNANPFIVGTGTQLQIQGSSLTFTKSLNLSGLGTANDGALLNVSGNNTWAGSILLSSNVYLGATTGSSLTIGGAGGTISDGASGFAINKEGGGTIVFANANSYRGTTTIDNGILQVQNSRALGTVGSQVWVRNTLTGQGTLSLLDPTASSSGPGTGLVFNNVPLVLDGTGFGGIGALYNQVGDNTWNGTVQLGSTAAQQNSIAVEVPVAPFVTAGTVTAATFTALTDSTQAWSVNQWAGMSIRLTSGPDAGDVEPIISNTATTITVGTFFGFRTRPQPGDTYELGASFPPFTSFSPTVSIDAASYSTTGTPTQLTINGVVKDPATAFVNLLEKTGTGRLILTADNTYLASTYVYQGYLQLRDSNALGPTTAGKTNSVEDNASLELAVDNLTDSLTGNTNTLYFSQQLNLQGTGVNGAGGALRSISGINVWNGKINLLGLGLTSAIGIGVDGDPNQVASNAYLYLEYSLTIGAQAQISGPSGYTLAKMGTGDLIMPTSNPYLGPTSIQQGWITAGNNQALGTWVRAIGDTVQPRVAVQNNAALMLLPMAGFTGIMTSGSNQITNVANISAANPGLQLGQPITGPGIAPGTTITNISGSTITISRNATVTSPVDPATSASIPMSFATMVVGGHIDFGKNLVLAGTGVSHKFGLINHEGALESLDGENVIGANYDPIFYQVPDAANPHSSWVALTGATGIGVEDVFSAPNTVTFPGGIDWSVGGTLNRSELTSVATILDYVPPVLNLSFTASGGQAEQRFPVDTGSTSGTITVTYNFYAIPDDLRVYYQGSRIFDSGVINGAGSFVIPYGPGASTFVELVMNEGNGLSGTAWDLFNVKIVPNAVPAGSLVKLGSRRLDLQGHGTYSAGVDIQQGVIRAQNDTALGAPNGSNVTVESGAALELAATNPLTSGGTIGGIDIQNKHLILNGPGNPTFGDYPLTNIAIDNPGVQANGHDIYNFPIAADNLWTGQVDLNTNSIIDVRGSTAIPGTITRLTLSGVITDGTNANGSSLTKGGIGELVLSGNNTYSGNTFIGVNPLLSFPLPDQTTATTTGRALTGRNTLGVSFTGDLTMNNGVVMNVATAGLAIGDVVTATGAYAGIPAGTTIIAINAAGPNTITLSNGATVTAAGVSLTTGAFTGNFTTLSNVVSNVNTNGLVVGELLTALTGSGFNGIQPGTTITAINTAANTITISQVATATANKVALTTAASLTPGETLTGPGLPSGTIITSVDLSSGVVRFNQAATATSTANVSFSASYSNKFSGTTTGTNNQITNVINVAKLSVGEAVGGPGIPGGAYIGSISGTTITLVDAVGNPLNTTAAGTNVSLGTGLPGGIATIENDNAFGIGATTVRVANGASLQIQGSLTIHNKKLIVEGNGSTTVPTVGQTWFNIGPAPINNGQTLGSWPVTGRVTGVAVDPTDSNVMYVSAAGGGAWKTTDGGATWQKMIEFAQNAITGTVVSTQNMYMGAIAIAPTDPRVLYVGTGESNVSPNGDNYAGNGILVSIDSGRTWSLIQPSTGGGFLGLTVGKIAVDPLDANVIYVAVSAAAAVTIPGTATGNVGVWRYDANSSTQWANLTQGKGVVDSSPTAVTNETMAIKGPTGAAPEQFTLSFNGSTTNPMFFGATAATVQTALNNLTSVKNVDPNNPITVSLVTVDNGDGTTTTTYTITYGGNFIGTTITPSPAISGTQVSNFSFPLTFTATRIASSSKFPDSGLIKFTQPDYSYVDVAVIVDPSDPARLKRIVSFSMYRPGGGTWDPTSSAQNVNGANGVFTAFYTPTANNVTPSAWYEFGFFSGNPVPGTSPVLMQSRGSAIKIGISVNTIDATHQDVYIDASIATSDNPTLITNPRPRSLAGIDQLILHFVEPPQPAGVPTGAPLGLFPPSNNGSPPYPQWVKNGLTNPGQYLMDNTNFGQGDYDQVLYVTPTNPNNVYLFGIGQGSPVNPSLFQPYFSPGGFVSHDGGKTWTDIGVADSGGHAPHAQYFAATMNPDGQLIVGTDGGIFRLNVDQTPGGIWTWGDLNGDLSITLVNNVGVDPNSNDNAFAGSMSNGVSQYSFNNLPTWTLVLPSALYNGGQIQFNQQSPNIVYAVGAEVDRTFNPNSYIPTLYESTQFGAAGTWTKIFQPPGATLPVAARFDSLFPFVVDPVNGSRVVVGGTNIPGSSGIHQSVNGGANFVDLNAPISVTALAVAANQGAWQYYTGTTPVADPQFPGVTDQGTNTYDPNTIYVTNGTKVYVTKNAGLGWVDVSSSSTPLEITALDALGTFNAADPQISSIMVDPRDRQTAYITTSEFNEGHVFKTSDGGRTWSDISYNLPNVPAWTIAIDQRTGDLYLGNDNGAYELANGTTTWNLFNTGLPQVSVRELVVNQTLNTITAATYGRGVFQLALDHSGINVPAGQPVGALSELSGTSNWVGNMQLLGDPINNTVTINVNGTQVTQNGFSNSSLNIQGTISDLTPLAFTNSPPTVFVNPHTGQNGALILSGANTFGGQMYIENGVVIANNPFSLGGAGGAVNGVTDVFNGASLELENDLAVEKVFLNGPGIPFNNHGTGALRAIANNPTFTGQIIIQTPATIGVDAGITLTVGSKAGLLGSGTITDASFVAPPIGGMGPYDLTKESPGTLVLQNADNYTGNTLVNQGVLQIRNGLALGGNNKLTTVVNGAQLELFGGILVNTENLNISGTGIGSTGALESIGGVNNWSGSVTLDTQAGGTGVGVPPTPPSNISIGVDQSGGVGTSELDINGVIGQSGTGNLGLVKVGSDLLVLNPAGGNNTYDGWTDIQGGILRIQQNGALGTAGGLSQPPPYPAIKRGTQVEAGTTLQLDGSIVGGLNVVGEDLTLNGGGGLAATVENYLGNNQWNGNLFLQSNIARVQVDGATTLTVGATGGTIQDATAFTGQTSNFITGDVTANSAQVTHVSSMDGLVVGQSISGTNIQPGTTIKQLLPASGIITLSQFATGTGTTTNVLLQISPSRPVPPADLQKTGTGTLILPGANTYTGTTFINAGAVQAQNNQALGGQVYSEIQQVNVSGTSGQWSLTFKGQTTTALNFGDSAATVQSALQALSSIGAGNVTVTQTNLFYWVTFTGALSQQAQPLLVANSISGTTVSVQEIEHGGGGGTVVSSGAALQLAGNITLNNETLDLTGTGINGHGALENGAGNNIVKFTGPVQSAFTASTGPTNGTIGVDAAGNTLSINQNLTLTGNDGVFVTTNGLTGSMLFVSGNLNLGNANLSGQVFNPAGINSGMIPIVSATSITNGSVFSQGGVAKPNGSTVTINGVSFIITYDYAGSLPQSAGTPTIYLNQTTTPTTLSLVGSPTTTVYGQDFIYTATLAPQGGGSVNPIVSSESITFTVTGPGSFGTQFFLIGMNSSGVATFDAAVRIPSWAVTPGSYQISASYPGDGSNYSGSNSTPPPLTQTVTKASTQTTVSANNNPAVIGHPDVITATVVPLSPGAGVPTGTVTFNITFTPIGGSAQNLAPVTVSLVGGIGQSTAQMSITPNSIGTYFITATYNADTNFNGSNTASALVLNSNQPPTTTSVATNGSPTTAGWPVVFTATVTDPNNFGTPTGTVTFSIVGGPVLGTAALSGSTAQLTTTAIPVGSWTIKASYNGDSTYLTSSGTVTQVINPTGPRTSGLVASGPTSSVVGIATTYVATVNGDGIHGTPTGYVTFYIDNVAQPIAQLTMVNGNSSNANITPTFTTAGAHTVYFVYTGDPTYSGPKTSNVVTDNVTLNPSSTSITSNMNPGVVGQPINFVATVTGSVGTPTGTVTWFVDGTNVGTAGMNASGQSNINWTFTISGNHTIQGNYSGSSVYAASLNTLTLPVSQIASSTSVVTSQTPSVFGTPVTFTATVTSGSGTPTGTVTFEENGNVMGSVNLSGGTASYSTTSLSNGTHTIKAFYNGSASYTQSFGTVTQVVGGTGSTVSTTTITPANGSTFNVGQTVNFKATVTGSAGTPTGWVFWTVDGTGVGFAPVNASGVSNINWSFSTTGSHSVVARYYGNPTTYAASTGSANYTVTNRPTSTSLVSNQNPAVPGTPVTFTATVSSAFGTPTGTVTFTVDNVNRGTVTLSGGVASITLSDLAMGDRTVQALYSGSSVDQASGGFVIEHIVAAGSNPGSQMTTTFLSGPSGVAVGQSMTVTASVSAPSGSPTGWVIFYINGVAQATVPLSGGAASLTTTFSGDMTFQAYYTGDLNFFSSWSNSLHYVASGGGGSGRLM